MPTKVFIPLVLLSIILLALTSPPILQTLIPAPAMTTTTTIPQITATSAPTATSDPFASVPTATPFSNGTRVVEPNLLPQPLAVEAIEAQPTQAVSVFPTLAPSQAITNTNVVLPDTVSAAMRPVDETAVIGLPVIPTPISAPPTRLNIPRLGLDVPVDSVGLIPSATVPGVLEWEVPAYRAAGWLQTSAPLGQPGNTVLDGHHNVHGEVFRDLWTLETGDKVTLQGQDGQLQQYQVSDVLILPERDQPLDVRLQNAQYIQPTTDERLTLVTCWPHNDNSHRTIVIAKPVHP